MTRSVLEMSWTAGFLEGEGSFSMCGVTPRIQVSQANRWPLEQLQRLFDGSISPKKPTPISRKPCYSWALGGPSAVGLMMTIYPIMTPTRQRQIARVLARWKATPTNFGDKHYQSTVKDAIARQAIQRVLDGESMTSVARSLGVTHTTVSYWVRGAKRAYLRRDVSGERSAWIKVRRPGMIADELALEGIRRVRAGALIKDVAKDIGVTPEALGYWVRGAHRPYLLAQLHNEESV